MLKKFFLNLLSSFLGAWIALLGFGIIAVIVIIGLIAKLGVASGDGQQIVKHSLLKISLEGPIEEAESAKDLNYMLVLQGNLEKSQTLNTLVRSIEEAAENKNIDGIYLECNGVQAGLATLDRLRKALIDFRAKGKKIYAYGAAYSAAEYFVASCADSLFVNSNGNIALQGISSNVPYFKGLLDKLGVEMQVVKVGTFKSAVEPYTLETMSGPARAQLDTLYGNIWKYIKDDICKSRKISDSQLDKLINQDYIAFKDADYAVKSKLADGAVSDRVMREKLANFAGVDKEKLNFISPSFLSTQAELFTNINAKNQIAVLYACGEITETSRSGINCNFLVPEIVKLADNENVKGLVLRVNSPGGSVFGSSEIAEALQYFKSKGKPFSVSMGDYAASGGYWISADAEKIFCDPLTITGSIGIFGMIPNFKGLADKIGVNMETVSTNPKAAFPNVFQPMDETQLSVMQEYIDRGYDRFIKRVAKGRNIPEQRVRQIAEGRVYDGMMAKTLGLVDEFGSLEDAADWTAEQAKIKDSYNICYYPLVEYSLWNFVPDKYSMKVISMLNEHFGKTIDSEILAHAFEILTRKPIQARMAPIDLGEIK